MPRDETKIIPNRIGNYGIVRKIADGGMAEVLLGRSTSEGGFEKLAAIKRILPHLSAEKTFIQMFLDEARIAAMLNHSNIAQIFELGRSDNTYFIAMEHVHGLSLDRVREHFTQHEILPPPSLTTYIVMNICAGLEYAHTRCDNQGKSLAIIHRDISPSNVLISFEGEVKLIDFGIAKAEQRLQQTKAGKIKGKFGYMSPEQVHGRNLDQRSDIFSAGMVLYELLTGNNPFHGTSEVDSYERARQAQIPFPSLLVKDLPEELEDICMKALSIAPQDRFQRAGEMEKELDAYWQKHPFTRIQLAAWMKQTFPEEHREGFGVSSSSPDVLLPAPAPPSSPRQIEPTIPLAALNQSKPKSLAIDPGQDQSAETPRQKTVRPITNMPGPLDEIATYETPCPEAEEPDRANRFAQDHFENQIDNVDDEEEEDLTLIAQRSSGRGALPLLHADTWNETEETVEWRFSGHHAAALADPLLQVDTARTDEISSIHHGQGQEVVLEPSAEDFTEESLIETIAQEHRQPTSPIHNSADRTNRMMIAVVAGIVLAVAFALFWFVQQPPPLEPPSSPSNSSPPPPPAKAGGKKSLVVPQVGGVDEEQALPGTTVRIVQTKRIPGCDSCPGRGGASYPHVHRAWGPFFSPSALWTWG